MNLTPDLRRHYRNSRECFLRNYDYKDGGEEVEEGEILLREVALEAEEMLMLVMLLITSERQTVK